MKAENAQQKINRIKQAAITLIKKEDVNLISLYDIARQAHIANSTVYHHFANIEALLIEIANEIFENLNELLDQVEAVLYFEHWSDITRQIEDIYVRNYRENPLAAKLILGQHKYYQLRQADVQNDHLLAKRITNIYSRHFILPALPKNRNVFAISLQAADKIYSTYYNDAGNIIPEASEEGCRLAIAYLALYLPHYLQRNTSVPTETEVFDKLTCSNALAG